MIRNCRAQTFVAIIVMAASTYVTGRTPNQPPAPDPLKAQVKMTATIEAIDRSGRLVTLKGEKGNVATVYAGPEVRRFDELKVGDKVTATYYESIAMNVRKPGEPAPPPSGEAVTPSKGAPGATAAVQDTVTVTVQSVDRANQSVTVKRQDGGIVSWRVQNPKYLEAVKAGDTVDITYTRALLLDVTPAK
jgi:hypothetical protein